jgi:hypothetical protein
MATKTPSPNKKQDKQEAKSGLPLLAQSTNDFDLDSIEVMASCGEKKRLEPPKYSVSRPGWLDLPLTERRWSVHSAVAQSTIAILTTLSRLEQAEGGLRGTFERC